MCAEEVQLPRWPAPAPSTLGSLFLVASADGGANLALYFVLRKQRFPERQQRSLMLICIYILELEIFFFLKHNRANTARVLCTPQLTHVALIRSLDWDSADAASHVHGLRFAGPQITFIL